MNTTADGAGHPTSAALITGRQRRQGRRSIYRDRFFITHLVGRLGSGPHLVGQIGQEYGLVPVFAFSATLVMPSKRLALRAKMV